LLSSSSPALRSCRRELAPTLDGLRRPPDFFKTPIRRLARARDCQLCEQRADATNKQDCFRYERPIALDAAIYSRTVAAAAGMHHLIMATLMPSFTTRHATIA